MPWCGCNIVYIVIYILQRIGTWRMMKKSKTSSLKSGRVEILLTSLIQISWRYRNFILFFPQTETKLNWKKIHGAFYLHPFLLNNSSSLSNYYDDMPAMYIILCLMGSNKAILNLHKNCKPLCENKKYDAGYTCLNMIKMYFPIRSAGH